jgi:hypothetical protein
MPPESTSAGYSTQIEFVHPTAKSCGADQTRTRDLQRDSHEATGARFFCYRRFYGCGDAKVASSGYLRRR